LKRKQLMDLTLKLQQIQVVASGLESIGLALQAQLKKVGDTPGLPRDGGLAALQKLARQGSGAEPLKAVKRVELALLEHVSALLGGLSVANPSSRCVIVPAGMTAPP